MLAEVIALADAIVAELNAATFSLEFEAQRKYLPRFELAALDTLRVTVVPKGLERQLLTRTSDKVDYEIDVAIHQRVAEVTEEQIDPLVFLVEEFCDHFRRGELIAEEITRQGGFGRPLKIVNEPIYDQKQLDEKKVFVSLLTFTWPRER